jgi:hypothetical protein
LEGIGGIGVDEILIKIGLRDKGNPFVDIFFNIFFRIFSLTIVLLFGTG